jgi:hypothetical protein
VTRVHARPGIEIDHEKLFQIPGLAGTFNLAFTQTPLKRHFCLMESASCEHIRFAAAHIHNPLCRNPNIRFGFISNTN